MSKNFPDEMTIDQSPVIIKEVRKAVKDTISQENNNISFKFEWHNHFSEKKDEDKTPYNETFRGIAKFALDDSMIYTHYLDQCKKAFIEEAIDRSLTMTEAAKLLGVASRTGINSIIKQLENKGYVIDK